jgi:hypothetical protein
LRRLAEDAGRAEQKEHEDARDREHPRPDQQRERPTANPIPEAPAEARPAAWMASTTPPIHASAIGHAAWNGSPPPNQSDPTKHQ